MIVEDLALDPRQGRARRLELRQDVDAVAPVIDHAGDAAHLALDPAQARQLALVIGVAFSVLAQFASAPSCNSVALYHLQVDRIPPIGIRGLIGSTRDGLGCVQKRCYWLLVPS